MVFAPALLFLALFHFAPVLAVVIAIVLVPFVVSARIQAACMAIPPRNMA